MPEYSGVAAVLPAAPIQADAGQGLMNLAERFLAVKQAKQQQAMSQVETSLKLAQAGWPVDDKAFAKFVKQAKLPIDLSTDSLSAQLKVAKDSRTALHEGGKADTTQKQGQEQLGVKPGMGPTMGGTPKEKAQSWIGQISERARSMMNLNASTEEQKAQNALTVEATKAKALAGDSQAMGTLIKMNQWEKAFSLDFAKWDAASSEMKGKMVGIAAGMESDADKASRGQRIGESILTSGKVTDPGSAYQMGSIIASGGVVPPALQAKVKSFSFQELSAQATMMDALVGLGVPPDKVGQVAQAAAHGGLENALPTGMKPIALEGLKIEQAKLGIEKLRYQKEVEIANRAAFAELRKGITEQQKADIEEFKNLVSLNKISPIPEDLIKGAQIKAAKALNMDVEEVNNLFHFLSGGTHLEFKPRLTQEGKSVVDKFSGKANKTPEASSFQKVLDAVKAGASPETAKELKDKGTI